MEHRRLGRTDLNVSLICLGTMTWGQQNTEADGHAQMDYALDKGINFFDTAELYSIPPRPETQGSTERIIGSWFKARGSRDKVILATKVIGRSDNTWFRDDGSKGELSRAQVEEAVNKSLKRLQTDYIDLYQIHWPDRPMPWGSNPTIFRHQEGESHPIAETVEIMTDLVKAGKIRHFGLSNESAWGTMSFLKHADAKGQARVQSVQNAYNLLNRTYEVALAEVTMQENVSLLAYSPLGQGYLSGKYEGGALPPGSRKTLFNRLGRYETANGPRAISSYIELARRHGLDPAQMAIAFAISRPFVTGTIIGATTMEQLKSDIAAAELTLADNVLEDIEQIHLDYPNPCP